MMISINFYGRASSQAEREQLVSHSGGSVSAGYERAFVFVQRFGETEAEESHYRTGIDGDRERSMDPSDRVQGLDHQGWLELHRARASG